MIPSNILKSLPEYYYNCTVGDYPLQLYSISKGYAYYINKNMSSYRVNAKNSWTNRNNTGTKEEVKLKNIKHNEDMINMLKSFNQHTKFKYCDIVDEAITRFRIKNCIQIGDYSVFRRKISRPYLKSLNNRLKLIYLLYAYLPNIACKLRSLKYYILGEIHEQ